MLSKIVEATNDLRADLVLLTGDLINMNVSDLPAALDAVKRMEGRYGVPMCEGNHDLIENGREFRRVTKASGVPLLVNETLDLPVRGRQREAAGDEVGLRPARRGACRRPLRRGHPRVAGRAAAAVAAGPGVVPDPAGPPPARSTPPPRPASRSRSPATRTASSSCSTNTSASGR